MRRTECWMAGKYLLPKLLLLISTDSLYLYCKNRIMGIVKRISLFLLGCMATANVCAQYILNHGRIQLEASL